MHHRPLQQSWSDHSCVNLYLQNNNNKIQQLYSEHSTPSKHAYVGPMLGQCTAICSYVGTTSHANVVSTLFCSLTFWRQHSANVDPAMAQRNSVIQRNSIYHDYVGPSLGQRLSNVIQEMFICPRNSARWTIVGPMLDANQFYSWGYSSPSYPVQR